MFEMVKQRLLSFGYEYHKNDDFILHFSVQKAENTIKNECYTDTIPEGLINIAVDIAVGEFLMAKKTFSPEQIHLDFDTAVKQIQTGDTNVTFSIGEGSLTPEQRLNHFINYILNYGRSEFHCYRKIKW